MMNVKYIQDVAVLATLEYPQLELELMIVDEKHAEVSAVSHETGKWYIIQVLEDGKYNLFLDTSTI